MRLNRRDLLKLSASSFALGLLGKPVPLFAASRGFHIADRKETDTTVEYEIVIKKERIPIGDKKGTAFLFNDNFPAPLIRLKEGKQAVIKVFNETDESTSIHWHGLILPNDMDGVPGVTYRGILPKSSFVYSFPVIQSGTYWYHSHTGLQEQQGHYGPLIIDPKDPEPFEYDRDYVVQLSDWTYEDPDEVLLHLKNGMDITTTRKELFLIYMRI